MLLSQSPQLPSFEFTEAVKLEIETSSLLDSLFLGFLFFSLFDFSSFLRDFPCDITAGPLAESLFSESKLTVDLKSGLIFDTTGGEPIIGEESQSTVLMCSGTIL